MPESQSKEFGSLASQELDLVAGQKAMASREQDQKRAEERKQEGGEGRGSWEREESWGESGGWEGRREGFLFPSSSYRLPMDFMSQIIGGYSYLKRSTVISSHLKKIWINNDFSYF